MTSRISSVDGLRAFAVLGVMWLHVWMFYDNVGFNIGPVDIHRLISFGGVGVDLFFVISGFCMYLMYAKRSEFSAGEYGQFIVKRWKRIAPAFYTVVLVECIILLIKTLHFPFKDFFSHLLFLNTFVSDRLLSPPFWSLSTEWQFYLILPFLFIGNPAPKQMGLRLLALMIISFGFRLLIYYQHMPELLSGTTITAAKIWHRFIEFGWGIIAARLFTSNKKLPFLFNKAHGFIIAFMIAYSGRIIMSTEFVNRFHSLAFVVRAFGEPLMTFGFGIMLWNVISAPSVFSRFLSLPIFSFLGRISYSMYLWHWIISWNVCHWLITTKGISAVYMNIAFVLCTLAVIPVSWLSYKLLEAPYFNKAKKVAPLQKELSQAAL